MSLTDLNPITVRKCLYQLLLDALDIFINILSRLQTLHGTEVITTNRRNLLGLYCRLTVFHRRNRMVFIRNPHLHPAADIILVCQYPRNHCIKIDQGFLQLDRIAFLCKEIIRLTKQVARIASFTGKLMDILHSLPDDFSNFVSLNTQQSLILLISLSNQPGNSPMRPYGFCMANHAHFSMYYN